MAQTSLVYLGRKFDSDEEVFFAMWLAELCEAGFVKTFTKIQEPIHLTHGLRLSYEKTTQLKTKIKTEQKEFKLLNSSEYTPDFEIIWTIEGIKKFLFQLSENVLQLKREIAKKQGAIVDPTKALFFSGEFNSTIVEIKPAFDQQNMERLFKNNQKFIWDKYKIFVNLVEPVALFKKTFMPAKAAPYFKYIKSPTGKNKGKKGPGDWKMDWEPRTLKQFLYESDTA
jgi:hypothetical protein